MKSKISNALSILLLLVAIAIVGAAIVLSTIHIVGSHTASKDSDFTVTIGARLAGSDSEYQDQLSAPAGSEVELKIEYVNCSNALQDNVSVWAELPEDLEYVNDTTHLLNAKTSEVVQIAENTIAKEGLNIGTYGGVSPENERGSNALVYLTVHIPETTASGTSLTPTARIRVNGRSNTASTAISITPALADPTTVVPDFVPPAEESSPEGATEASSSEENSNETTSNQSTDAASAA